MSDTQSLHDYLLERFPQDFEVHRQDPEATAISIIAAFVETRERLAAAPYCASCGRVNLAAPQKTRAPLEESGLELCHPSDCPGYETLAVYDRIGQKWVLMGDLNSLPTKEQ